ncbi:hypothetical protein D4740_02000 [Actinomyces sp. 2119]|nr:hypothetical protein D4740_02000 [Actinomyces sp. 2119]
MGELVVLAEHARGLLRAEVPVAAVGGAALVVAAWFGVPALPWLAWACAVGSGGLALRHARPPRGSCLRAGAWTGIVLLVLDLVMAPWTVALLVGLRLGSAPHPLLAAAGCAVSGAMVGTLVLALTSLASAVGARRRAHPAPRAGTGGSAERLVLRVGAGVGVVLLAAAVSWLVGEYLRWWLVGAVAVVTEAGAALVVRLGAWAQRQTAK